MDLIIDIGNSRIKAAEFLNDGIHKLHFAYLNEAPDLFQKLEKLTPQKILISSTAQPNMALPVWKNKTPLLFNHNTALPVKNAYKTPNTLGLDRIAGAVGANYLWPGKNILIIDFGTCITSDIITNHTFLGGAISPGLMMRYKAMHTFTGRLPQPDFTEQAEITGNTTEGSLHSGVQFGIIGEINNRIATYMKQYEDLHVVICGGDAPYFVNRLNYKIFANQNLVLIGLNQILKYNA